MEQSIKVRALKLFIGALTFLCFGTLIVLTTSAPGQTAAIQQWTPTTSFPVGIANREAVVHGDYIYVVGGKVANTNQATNIVRSAKIDSLSGGLSAWQTTTALPDPLYLHAVTASDTHLYVIGGWDGNRNRNEVYRAAFQADGKLGGWQQLGDFPRIVDLHDAVIVNNRIYVSGGYDAGSVYQDVYVAAIQSNGLGPWTRTTDMPQGRYRHVMLAYNDYIYVIGGATYSLSNEAETAHADVFYAKVNSNGTVGAWQTATELPAPRFYHGAVIYDDRILVLGGTNERSQLFASAISIPIQSNGTLGAWNSEPNMPEGLYRFAAVSVRRFGSDFVYLIGGLISDTVYRASVYHSAVPPTPTATPTSTPTPALITTMQNDPVRWVAPGDEVRYTIYYSGNNSDDFADVTIQSVVPDNTELVAGSVSVSGEGTFSVTGDGQAGSTIDWQWTTLPAAVQDSVAYSVRRLPPPTPMVPPVIAITLNGPATASRGAPITYELTLRAPIQLMDVTVTNQLPLGATYISGGDGPPVANVVTWTIPVLPAETDVTLALTVSAQSTLVNSDVQASFAGGGTFAGNDVVVTVVDGTLPPANGDGVTILNAGASIRWRHDNNIFDANSNSVRNPQYDIFLPQLSNR